MKKFGAVLVCLALTACAHSPWFPPGEGGGGETSSSSSVGEGGSSSSVGGSSSSSGGSDSSVHACTDGSQLGPDYCVASLNPTFSCDNGYASTLCPAHDPDSGDNLMGCCWEQTASGFEQGTCSYVPGDLGFWCDSANWVSALPDDEMGWCTVMQETNPSSCDFGAFTECSQKWLSAEECKQQAYPATGPEDIWFNPCSFPIDSIEGYPFAGCCIDGDLVEVLYPSPSESFAVDAYCTNKDLDWSTYPDHCFKPSSAFQAHSK